MLKLLFASLLMMCGLFGDIKNANEPVFKDAVQSKIESKSEETEAFLSYYRDDFRKDENGNLIAICDISYASFRIMYTKYGALSSEDKIIVNNTEDYEEGYTIKDSIDTLIDRFSKNQNPSNSNKRTLDQSSSIIVIVVVAVFGMSTICVFFVLKNGNIIQ